MNKIPGSHVSTPRDLLLTEIGAVLEGVFADFQERVFDSVQKLIAAETSEQLQAPHTIRQVHATWEPNSVHAATVGHMLDWTPPKLGVPQQEKKDCSAQQEQKDCSASARTEEQKDIQQDQVDPNSRELVEEDHATCDQTSEDLFSNPVSTAEASEQLCKPVTPKLSSLNTRLSLCSTPDIDVAHLRMGFDSELDSDRGMKSTRCSPCGGHVNASTFCEALGVESIEPKDLHFDELAARRGKRWKDLSLSEQVSAIREELTRTSCTIDPQSDSMKFWDILIMCCLLYTGLALPYEIAFIDTEYGPLYVVNHVVNMLFVLDMVLQFFLKVSIVVNHKTRWVRNRRQIAAAYLKSWFVVDLFSIVPYDDIRNLASSGDGEDAGLEHLKVMRLLRVLRILRLFRMLKASRLVKRWENRNCLQSTTKYLLRCCILILVTGHWMACIWGFIGIWEGSNLKCRRTLQDDDELVLASPTASWYVDIDEGKAPNDSSAWKGQSWVVAFSLGRAASMPIDPCNPPSLYVVSLYWAIMTMTSIGYGDILPQAVSEYVVCCICMVVSGVVWAYIIGVASAVLTNMSPETTQFEQRMDAFNCMAHDMHIPAKVRLRGREFLRECRYKWSHDRNLAVIKSLGLDLQANLSKQSSQRYLGKINLFARCSELFRADCAASMDPHFFEPHYIIQLDHLCVVEKGAVGHAGRVLVPWNHWGEDFIVAKMQLRFQAPAVAMNYALVVSLSLETVESVLASHPAERLLFMRAAVCMAMTGAVRIYRLNLAKEEILPEHRWIHELIDKPAASDKLACVETQDTGVASFKLFDDCPHHDTHTPPQASDKAAIGKLSLRHNGISMHHDTHAPPQPTDKDLISLEKSSLIRNGSRSESSGISEQGDVKAGA